MERKRFELTSVDPDPIKEFKKWIALADQQSQGLDIEAMTLATVSSEGKPSARVVLFKGLKNGGFVFYTNYESKKSKELDNNPNAALVFYWPTIYRQVRVTGPVAKLSRLDSEDYFRTRPRESQLAAWASQQSSQVKSIEQLNNSYDLQIKKFDGKEIPCPPFWGGYRLEPEEVEFWLGQDRRMHHRFQYVRTPSQQWKQVLLFP